MSDLIDSPGQGENAPEYSVSELSSVLKRMIEGEFSNVRIRGEVGRVSKPASGHLYFDLKDDIVKVRYLKVNKKAPQVKKIRKIFQVWFGTFPSYSEPHSLKTLG